jgi:hypothetical protein
MRAAMSALTRPCGRVLISVSRAAAAVEDRTIAVDEYVRLIGERLDGFRRVFAREE